MVGIVDQALPQGEKDDLKISSYKNALVDFIKRTDTPMTIGVQGEWGSGKTSLLNQIWADLESSNKEDDSVDDFKQIWINSWENSLLCSPEECLMKIINEIISELLDSDTDKKRSDKIRDGVNNIMKGALRIGSSIAVGSAGVDAVDEIFSEGSNSIKELREQLKNLVTEIKTLDSNRFGKIIVYVDDLDRIEPKDAVSILELLKNIFNIQDCVFVLAIDYQVVVKGLVGKFGKPTPENDWEFRAFFDKIIQLPFSMPMGNYDIANYVIGLLGQINFYSGKEDLDEELIRKFVTKSIGGNPRSIKRLINSLALIKILNDIEDGEESDGTLTDVDAAMIMFAMVCLQIAHPEIYQLFADNPNYKEWNKELAYRETQGKEESDENWEKNFEQAVKTDNFNEPWEQCLFRVCYSNPRRRAKAGDISEFISIFDEEFKDSDRDVNELIESALGKTAVTSVSSKENPNIRPPKGSYKPHYVTGYDAWLKNKIEKENYEKKFPDFPSEACENIIKMYIKVLKSKPYNAIDFDPSKPTKLKDYDSDYVLKYSGAIAVYYKGSKIGCIGGTVKSKESYIYMETCAIPKHECAPLIFTKSNIEFNHMRIPHSLDEDARKISGNGSRTDFKNTEFPASKASISEDLIRFLIDESTETKEDPEIAKEVIREKKVKQYIEDFKNKRKDTKEYTEAVTFLKTYFDKLNKKKIDL